VNPNGEAAISKNPQSVHEFLSWENLGAQSPWLAFRQSLRELVLDQKSFYDKMAVSGGLHEPLGFLWIALTALILPSFPLALAYFGLTAPDPGHVSVEEYNAYLLAPRVAGFATILLPLVLVLCGVLAVVCGSLLHVGSRLFGARSWEGCVSIWCYSLSSWFVTLALGVAFCAVVSIVCYLAAMVWPGTREGAAGVARVILIGAMGLTLLAGMILFLVSVFTGCIRKFRLGGTRGAAAAVTGLILVGLLLIMCPVAFDLWGARWGLVTVEAFAGLVVLLTLVVRMGASRSERGQ